MNSETEPGAASDDTELLRAVSRLRRFTPAEAAAHAGVRLSAVEAFLHGSSWVELVAAPGSIEVRPRRAVWRVVPALAAQLATVVSERARKDIDAERLDEEALLDKTLATLEAGKVPPGETLREVALAKLYLRGVEADLADSREKAAKAWAADRARFSALRRRLAAVTPARHDAPDPPVARGEVDLEQALFDWSRPLPQDVCGSSPLPEAGLLQEQAVSLMFGPIENFEGAESPYAAAVQAIALRQRLSPEDWNAARKVATERLRYTLSRPDARRMLAPASVLAMALEAGEASDAILQAVLRSEDESGVSLPGRRVCLAALSRLARESKTDRRAASACLYLVGRTSAASELALLIPAALCVELSDVGALMQRAASILSGSVGTNPGPFVRSLATAMFMRHASVGNDGALQAALLTRPEGQSLLRVLVTPAHLAARVLPGLNRYELRPSLLVGQATSLGEWIQLQVLARTQQALLLAELVRLNEAEPSVGPQSFTNGLRQRRQS